MRSTSGFGFCHIHAQAKAGGVGFYHNWRVIFGWPGMSRWKQQAPFVLCDKCQVVPNVECGRANCGKAAAAWALRELHRWNVELRANGKVAELEARRTAKDAPRVVEMEGGTVGDWEALVVAHWGLEVKTHDEHGKLLLQPKRMAWSPAQIARRGALRATMRVLARAFDLWREGAGVQSVHEGQRTPDVERIRKLPLVQAFHHEAARRSFDSAVARDLQSAARAEHVSLNSDFKKVGELFTPDMRARCYEGRLKLPDGLEKFLKYPRLGQPSPSPEPLTHGQFAELVAACESLRETDPDLWLLAKVARQTLLRCGSLRELCGSWVSEIHGRWWLKVQRNADGQGLKRGSETYSVKILPETAALILARGPGYTFGDDEAARRRLVNDRHTALMKSVVGMPQRGNQQAHRLRDTGAGAVFGYFGDKKAAAAALGHANVSSALNHYARNPMEASALMLAEYGAFLV